MNNFASAAVNKQIQTHLKLACEERSESSPAGGIGWFWSLATAPGGEDPAAGSMWETGSIVRSDT